ncbi:MAG: class I SAM-dependent methyltransferase [Melioribacteraceae bacterium]|nr:class I SAM-dependent methyltransferase [Melioribacteraceae bacterium]
MNEITVDENNFDYFVEWGSKSWKKLLYHSIYKSYGENNFNNKKLLDIGCRYGRTSVLFALLGAHVMGIDTNSAVIEKAKLEALKNNVKNRTKFLAYDGDLDIFPDNSFDIIFTKSVLVVVDELELFLTKINRKLKSEGKVIFLENGYGNKFIHFFRRFRHKKWDYTKCNFFNEKDINIFKATFNIIELRKNFYPPIWFIYGGKRY